MLCNKKTYWESQTQMTYVILNFLAAKVKKRERNNEKKQVKFILITYLA